MSTVNFNQLAAKDANSIIKATNDSVKVEKPNSIYNTFLAVCKANGVNATYPARAFKDLLAAGLTLSAVVKVLNVGTFVSFTEAEAMEAEAKQKAIAEANKAKEEKKAKSGNVTA